MSIQRRYLTKRGADGKPIIGPDGKPMEDRAQPRYRVQVATRDPMTGKRRNVTVGTYRTKREAEASERDALTKQERGTLLDPAKTTVAELLIEWLAVQREITSQTAADYEITIRRHLVPAFGGMLVQKLTVDHVQAQYDAWTAVGMSARQVRGCHLRLSQALDYAVSRRLLYVNVGRSTKLPPLPTKRPEVWDASEVRQFLEAAAHDGLSPLWHLLVLEGMRRGEALGLRWRDLNWERGTAHIVQTVAADKSNRGAPVILDRTKTRAAARTVKLSGRTIAILKEHRRAQSEHRLAAPVWSDNDLIVSTGRGTPVNPNNVSRSFQVIVRGVGLRRIRVDDLRHTHATLLLKQRVPAKIVSERLGHATIGITLDTYSHVLPDMQDLATEAIEALLTATEPTV